MLKEIRCEKFHQQIITFNKGLNVILGTNEADNSIGKSTFLLVVDFVFGGNTYANQENIIKNIGSHDIYFCFNFNDKLYKFCRNNMEADKVWICDDEYNKLQQKEIDEYCEWLDESYKLQLPKLTFRNAVGRYMRIYGKENYSEKHPLNRIPNEKEHDAIMALIKLFNLYTPIENADEQFKKSKEEYSTYNKAQRLSFIPKITKTKFDKNEKEIKKISDEIDKLSCGFFDLDSSISEQALEIKNNLSKIRRIKGKLKSRYNILLGNLGYKFSITNDSLDNLKKYFPQANIKHIEEIEGFHNKISRIFKAELNEEKSKLEEEISDYENIINNFEAELQNLTTEPNLSKLVLSKHTLLLKEKERLIQENEAYLKINKLEETKKKSEKLLKEIKDKQLSIISSEINAKLKTLNTAIYTITRKAPILSFNNNSYSFFTPDDTGTGIAYKGLVIFDLSVLELTELPVLIHDSIIFKNISDEAIQKIIEMYSNSGKQIIIAFDKQKSYGEKTYNLLDKSSVLKLSDNGNQLFGFSWA